MDLLGDFFGYIIGDLISDGIRTLLARRSERRARSGNYVKIRAHAEVDGLPGYRSLRGFLVRRRGKVIWRPLLVSRVTRFSLLPPKSWECGPFELSEYRCIGSHRGLSGDRGREVYQLIGPVPLRSISVTTKFAVAARILLPSSYGY